MAFDSILLLLPLPEAARPWLVLNLEHHVIICYRVGCQHAISPRMVSRHLRDKHQVQIDIRKQIQLYLEQWQWLYDS